MEILKFWVVKFVNAQSCVWIDSNEEQLDWVMFYKTDTKSDTDSKLENIE